MRRGLGVVAAVAVAVGVASLVWWLGAVRGTSEMPTLPTGKGPRANMMATRLQSRVIPAPEEGERRFPETFPTRMTSARGTLPFVVMAAGVATREIRARVVAAGARVTGAFGGRGLLVEADAAALRRLAEDKAFVSADEFLPADKVSRRLREEVARVAADDHAMLRITIVPLATEDKVAVAAAVRATGGELPEGLSEGRKGLRVRVPATAVAQLAERGDIRWLEPFEFPHLLNDRASSEACIDVDDARSLHGLTGKGQYVAILDSGVDSGYLDDTMHPDLRNRICRIVQFGLIWESDDGSESVSATHTEDYIGHGTHTSGSIAGDGTASEGEIRGMAPGAKLYVECAGVDQSPYLEKGSMLTPAASVYLTRDRNLFPYAIHSDSWGGSANVYDSEAIALDEALWENAEILAVFSAGNSGSRNYTVTTPGTAKNCLTAGATQNDREEYRNAYYHTAGYPNKVTTFSSRGPTSDGRLKPDVVAPGSRVLSVRSHLVADASYSDGVGANTNYAYMTGTSMSAPITAGAAALVREWLMTQRGFTNALPTAALMKAILTGGAQDLSVLANTTCKHAAPYYDQGWGRVRLNETLFPEGREVILKDRIPFRQGHVWQMTVTTTNVAPLDVQLVWTDHAGTEGSDYAIVNDLDLEVTDDAGNLYYGNGGTQPDVVNTVEGVRLSEAPAGTYVITVRSSVVTYDSDEGGAAAVYLRGAFAVGEEASAEIAEDDLNLLTKYDYSPDWSIKLSTPVETWYPSGTVVRIAFPDDSGVGTETSVVDSVTFRLGGVWVSDTIGNSILKTDPRTGMMATNFTWRLNAQSTLLRFLYYDISSTYLDTTIPYWWYLRYLYATAQWLGTQQEEVATADFDGDGLDNAGEWAADTNPVDETSNFRIEDFSASSVTWRGGHERTQVLERTEDLASDVWEGVYTNLPPTETHVTVALPQDETHTNNFYRVRIMEE